jgi:hypothetical protein
VLPVVRAWKPAGHSEQKVAPGVDVKKWMGHTSQPPEVPRVPGGHGMQDPPALLQWPFGQFGHTFSL